MSDKVQLFKYRRGSYINVYCLDGYYDYYYGYMVPDTGYLECFDVVRYREGLMLMLPDAADPAETPEPEERAKLFETLYDTGYLECFDVVRYREGLMLMLPDAADPAETPEPEERAKLFETLYQSSRWGDRIGIDTVGDLNDKICEGDLAELILVQEALQESRIGKIAEEIAARPGDRIGIDTVGDLNDKICEGDLAELILVQEALQESRIGKIAEEIAARPHVKFVMIAGPSSSGKTTFSHRLSIQLKTFGLNPHPIAVDNYFIDRDS